MKITEHIEVKKIDPYNEVELCINCNYCINTSERFINKEEAIKLIAHLQEEFGI